MLIEIKNRNSDKKMSSYIDSSSLISMEIINTDKRNERSAVIKVSYNDGVPIPYILQSETINNSFVNDR